MEKQPVLWVTKRDTEKFPSSCRSIMRDMWNEKKKRGEQLCDAQDAKTPPAELGPGAGSPEVAAGEVQPCPATLLAAEEPGAEGCALPAPGFAQRSQQLGDGEAAAIHAAEPSSSLDRVYCSDDGGALSFVVQQAQPGVCLCGTTAEAPPVWPQAAVEQPEAGHPAPLGGEAPSCQAGELAHPAVQQREVVSPHPVALVVEPAMPPAAASAKPPHRAAAAASRAARSVPLAQANAASTRKRKSPQKVKAATAKAPRYRRLQLQIRPLPVAAPTAAPAPPPAAAAKAPAATLPDLPSLIAEPRAHVGGGTGGPQRPAFLFETAAQVAKRAGQHITDAAPSHYALRPLPPPPALALPLPSQSYSAGLGGPSPAAIKQGTAPGIASREDSSGAALPALAAEMLAQPGHQGLAGLQQPAAAGQLPPPQAPCAAPPAAKQQQQQQLTPAQPTRPAPAASTVRTGGPSAAAAAVPTQAPTELASYLQPVLRDAMMKLRKLTRLYQWQADCLHADPRVLGDSASHPPANLVLSAPTSGGKTLVAEVLMLRRLGLDPGRKCMLVVPFHSMCKEAAASLAPLVAILGKEVKEVYGQGASDVNGGPSTGIIVCTIELAIRIINQMIETGRPLHEELSCVVIDELHMVGNTDRGYLLELLLTKLRYQAATQQAAAAAAAAASVAAGTSGGKVVASSARPSAAAGTSITSPHSTSGGGSSSRSASSRGVQIVGMSATLPNLAQVASWLDAVAYASSATSRPVPLHLYIKVGQELRTKGQRVERLLPPPAPDDPHHVTCLVEETVATGHSVLLFCATKRACVVEASRLSKALAVPDRGAAQLGAACDGGADEHDGFAAVDFRSRAAVAAELEALSTQHSAALAGLVRAGVAYHNSDLSPEEKRLVEGAYRRGAVSVLCATSTLAAGVNLPARRVIFRHGYLGTSEHKLTSTEFLQMAGRAGRAGIDDRGEAVLLHAEGGAAALAHLERLMSSTADSVSSCLARDGMRRAMLELVASVAAASSADVKRFVQCTLLAALEEWQSVSATVKAALQWLGDARQQASSGVRNPEPLIEWTKEGTYIARPLGKAVFGSGLTPEEALQMKADLERAMDTMVLTSDLHAAFLSVPVYDEIQMKEENWKALYSAMRRIANKGGPDYAAMQHIGVQPGFVQSRLVAGGRGRATDAATADQERTCSRFYAACILHRLIQKEPTEDVVREMEVMRSTVEKMQESASRFAGKAAAFCERMGKRDWSKMAALLKEFASRVCHGASVDILPLTDVRGVKASTARLLYAEGLQRPEDIAAADIAVVERALGKGPPVVGKSRREAKEFHRAKARAIQDAAKKMVMQQAKELMEKAGGDGNKTAGRLGGQQQQQQQPVARRLCQQAAAALPADRSPQHQRAPPEGGGACTEEWEVAHEVERARAHARRPAPPSMAPRPALDAGPASQDAPAIQRPAPEAGLAFHDAAGIQLVPTVAAVRALCTLLQGCKRFGVAFHSIPSRRVDAAAAAADFDVPGAKPKKRKQPPGDETDAGGPREVRHPAGTVLGLAVSWRHGRAAFVPLQGADGGDPASALAAELAALLAKPEVEVVALGWKRQVAACRWLMAHGASGGSAAALPPGMLDARIAAWMAHPDAAFVTDGAMSGRTSKSPLYPGAQSTSGAAAPDQLLTKVTGSGDAAAASCAGITKRPGVSRAVVSACRTAALARTLYESVLPRLVGHNLLPALLSTEMPLVPVMADMEAAGVAMDCKVLRRLAPRLKRRLAEVQQAVQRIARCACELTSPKQVQDLLYKMLKLAPPPCATKHKTRADGTRYTSFSANKEALEALAGAHPVVSMISEHRKLSDTLSTVEAMLAHAQLEANAASSGWDDGFGAPASTAGVVRVRGYFLHTATGTGRLAMEDPNLQCMPKPHPFKALASPTGTAGGSQPLELTPGGQHRAQVANMRAAFVAPPGCCLLSADFRQIEFRVMAHFSGDATLRPMLADGGRDPFVLMASRWRQLAADEVTREQRDSVKAILYGLCYGMGPQSMGEGLGITGKAAAKLRDEFLATFSGVARWLQQAVEDCRSCGYVTTLHGRRRWLPHITAEEPSLRAAAERCAVNSICQGSAADLAKVAMISIHRRLAQELPPGAARLLLQIHDELVVEVAQEHCGAAATVVRECMEGAGELEVPLRARLCVGPSWGELQEMMPAG